MRADLTRRIAGVLLAAGLLAGCAPETPAPPPEPQPTQNTSSEAPPEFAVVTVGELSTFDPVAVSSDAERMVAAATFQRLMRVVPGSGELKPDLAVDCLFTAETVYRCELPQGLKFHNGHTLDATDVRFSLQRALRLATPNTSITWFNSLKRITTPDPLTVEFELAWPDNQFGFALAGMAASIVDAETAPADAVEEGFPVGSGPLQLVEADAQSVRLTAFTGYQGPRPAGTQAMRVELVADSASAEARIAQGDADVVWRSLDSGAVQRLADEVQASGKHQTARGFTQLPLSGQRVTRLWWNPDAKLRANAKLRTAIATTLQADRTLDSLVPEPLAGRVASWPMGGSPVLGELGGKRRKLTLGYDPSAPGHADLARQLRDRLEQLDSLSVRVVTDPDADLWLSDQPAWVDNAFGWLQPYLSQPLAQRAEELGNLEQLARTSRGAAQERALSRIQAAAAVDNTGLPISQTAEILYLGPGVKVSGDLFGSGRELGLWGFSK